MLKSKSLWKSCIYIAMAAVVTLSITAGTFAKYTSKVDTTDTARVAKFEYTLKNGTTEITDSLNLFSETYGGTTKGIASADDATIKKVVAPGAKGGFALSLINTGEVRIKVKIDNNGSNIPDTLPIIFKYGTKYYTNYAAFQNKELTVNETGNTSGTSITLADGTANVEPLNNLFTAITAAGPTVQPNMKLGTDTAVDVATVNWFWPYEVAGDNNNDIADTNLGEAGSAQCEVKFRITVDQIDTDYAGS